MGGKELTCCFFKKGHYSFQSFEGVKQIANVAALSGIVEKSVWLPDILAGYGN